MYLVNIVYRFRYYRIDSVRLKSIRVIFFFIFYFNENFDDKIFFYLSVYFDFIIADINRGIKTKKPFSFSLNFGFTRASAHRHNAEIGKCQKIISFYLFARLNSVL